MNEVYYLSGDGRNKVSLDREPYWMQTGDILDYEWAYTVRNKRIRGFDKDVTERSFLISVFGGTEEEYGQNWNHLHNVFEKDVREGTPGQLFFGEHYLRCYIIASAKSEWEYDCLISDNELTLVTDYPHWIREAKKQFFPQDAPESEIGLDYSYDYPYEYALNTAGTSIWVTDHFDSSEYQMTIYGPCSDPRVLINGYPIQVFDVLEANDYLIIDSRENTVMKYLANGTLQNLYDNRAKQQSIFEKIPGGNLMVNWNGSFGFDLTLYQERSEPKWN